jgi:hypothetical protein
MKIDLYRSQSAVVVWNYLMLIVMVAFDGYLSEFVDTHLKQERKTITTTTTTKCIIRFHLISNNTKQMKKEKQNACKRS